MKAKVKELYREEYEQDKMFNTPFDFYVDIYRVYVNQWAEGWFILEFGYYCPSGKYTNEMFKDLGQPEIPNLELKKLVLDVENKGQAIREGVTVYNWLKEHSDNEANQLDYSKLNIRVQSL